MEPHREEQPKTPQASAERKRKRFRIVKLEEKLAPGMYHGTHASGCYIYSHNGKTCACPY
jgi:hypothetical protein